MHSRHVVAFLLGCATAAAAPTVTTTLSGRVFQDTNVFLQDPSPLAAGQARVGEPASASDTGFDALATVALGWKPAPGTSLDLSYAPERVQYLNHASENHTDHALAGAVATELGDWSANATAKYLLVDGSDASPVYNALGGGPAIGGEPVRARRAQAIGRAAGKVTRKLPAGFARGVFSVFDQQFHTRESSAYGYCNYADRGEASVGADLGWRPVGPVALVAGVRRGNQRQANLLGVPLNFTNTFTRWLVGVEGSPTSTVKLALLAGPDYRQFGESVRAGFERRQSTGYGEASATWTPTRRDTVAVAGKRYLWVSSGGRGVYSDAVLDLSWKRKVADAWTTSLGANVHEGDTSHFNVWAPRRDRIYTATAGVSHALSARTRVDVDVLHDWGVSLVPTTPGREYTRWIGAVGIARTW